MTAPIERVAADWAAGPAAAPRREAVAGATGGCSVERLTWPGPDGPAAAPAATLYRIVGGGHTWPGGAQYLPARIVGPVATGLDATGIMLDFVRGR